MVWISRHDSAWNRELIDAELASCGTEGSPWASQEDHPFTHYHNNKSRLDVNTVRAYLRGDVEPTEFVVRRIKLSEWNMIENLLARSHLAQARTLAIAYGLAEIKGVEFSLRRKKAQDPIDDETLDSLRAALESDWMALGFAILAANAPLSEDEKRPFDSSRGD